MKNSRDYRRDDNQDDIDLELRWAYERGRRDQRGRPTGSPFTALLLVCLGGVALALVFFVAFHPAALNWAHPSQIPAASALGTSDSSANASGSEPPAPRQPRKASPAGIT